MSYTCTTTYEYVDDTNTCFTECRNCTRTCTFNNYVCNEDYYYTKIPENADDPFKRIKVLISFEELKLRKKVNFKNQ